MADIHQPHDRIFRAVFSDIDEAVGLLQTALPDTIRNHFHWNTLTLLDGSFIDDEMRGSQSDLLYQVEHVGTGQPVSMYLLFEHQSSPDPWMRFRLLSIVAASGKPIAAMTRDHPSWGPPCRWFSVKGQGVGPTQPNMPICSPKPCGPGRGCRGLRTNCWTRRAWNPKRSAATSRAVSPSC